MDNKHTTEGLIDDGSYRILFAMVYCKIEPLLTKDTRMIAILNSFLSRKCEQMNDCTIAFQRALAAYYHIRGI